MALITDYIRKNGLDHLIASYDLKACYHSELPLVILNYSRTANKNSPYTNTCLYNEEGYIYVKLLI